MTYDIPFSSIIEAWIEFERNKRSSASTIRLRWNAPQQLSALWRSIRDDVYTPRRSTAFVVEYPVKREIFAAAAIDRVVHHWIAHRIVPILEKLFKDVGDFTMNCRKCRGNMVGHKVLGWYINAAATASDQKRYIVGGDFANFFMSINKQIVQEAMGVLLWEHYKGDDLPLLERLLYTTIANEPQRNCIKACADECWEGLPKRKSLFHTAAGCGLPIGNFPSQLMANLLGAIFGDWMVHVKGFHQFVIYCDDFRVIVPNRYTAKWLIREIRGFLYEQLRITLHPHKIYLQHYTKGTSFVGAVIKPGRMYISNRSRGRFITTMMEKQREWKRLRKQWHGRRGYIDMLDFLDRLRAVINSYLGLFNHYQSYKLRRRLCMRYVVPMWGQYIYFIDGFRKAMIKISFENRLALRRHLRHHDFAATMLRPRYTE